MYIKGVNLGNWLVLEKWMSPGLFAGTTAEDEYYLPARLPRDVYEARIRTHRAEYITERDFTRIKAMGMNTVRIPVPYFIFGDREPFIGCVEELDRAFAGRSAMDLRSWWICIPRRTARTVSTTAVSAVCASGLRSRRKWSLS